MISAAPVNFSRIPAVARCKSTATVESYPTEPGFIRASVELVKEGLAQATGDTRVLFSAHGLPEKTIRAGDPYRSQVEQTAAR